MKTNDIKFAIMGAIAIGVVVVVFLENKKSHTDIVSEPIDTYKNKYQDKSDKNVIITPPLKTFWSREHIDVDTIGDPVDDYKTYEIPESDFISFINPDSEILRWTFHGNNFYDGRYIMGYTGNIIETPDVENIIGVGFKPTKSGLYYFKNKDILVEVNAEI